MLANSHMIYTCQQATVIQLPHTHIPNVSAAIKPNESENWTRRAGVEAEETVRISDSEWAYAMFIH